MKQYIVVISLLAIGMCTTAYAQSYTKTSPSMLGIKAGVNFGGLEYSNSDLKDYRNAPFGRAAFGVYIETFFKKNLSLRPEFLFVGKGQKIDNLGISYQLKSNYFEMRLPVLYTYKLGRLVSPYVIAGPTLGLATGGKIIFDSYETKISKANLASFDYGYTAGIGMKIPLNTKQNSSIITIELVYNHALSNNYGDLEKDGTATALNDKQYSVEGTRKNKGIEVSVSLAIPLQRKQTRCRCNY